MKEPNKKQKIFRIILVVGVFALLIACIYIVLKQTGVWQTINSIDKLRNFILSLGFWGKFAYVFLQFLQVTFLPIPSAISTLAGVLIYGPLQASLLSLSGILFGSIVAFWLGRTFGKKLIIFMVGEDICKKWTNFLTDAKYAFFVMMILPIFPDDILCLVAGVTDMSWTFFAVTNLIARPLGIFLTCYIGSGQIIPYHGWGLVVWSVLLVLVVVAVYLSFKYKEKIERLLKKTFRSR